MAFNHCPSVRKRSVRRVVFNIFPARLFNPATKILRNVTTKSKEWCMADCKSNVVTGQIQESGSFQAWPLISHWRLFNYCRIQMFNTFDLCVRVFHRCVAASFKRTGRPMLILLLFASSPKSKHSYLLFNPFAWKYIITTLLQGKFRQNQSSDRQGREAMCCCMTLNARWP